MKPNPLTSAELQAAIKAARAAGELLRNNFNQPRRILYKDVINMVTDMDKASERLLREQLLGAFPDYSFLGEEGEKPKEKNGACWIVDPLDGTSNYARSYPLFDVSIALEKGEEIVLGVVYNPLLDEMFTAVRGQGAFLNAQAIHVSETAELGQALLASGFPYDAWTNPNDNCRRWAAMIKQTVSVRCDGAAALDLCYTAAGRLDAYWEEDLEAWDVAAGALIVQEAGGMVTLVNNEKFDPYKRSLLASNSRLHEAMLAALKEADSR